MNVSRLLLVFVLLAAACGSEAQAVVTAPPPLPVTTTVVLPAEATTTTTTVTVDPVTLVFGGDVSLTHGLVDADPFADVATVLQAADLSWVNLETAVAEESFGFALDKEYLFRSPPAAAGLLAAAGIDGVALANNHSLDAGTAGLERTIELLDQAGVKHAGAGMNSDQAYAPVVEQVGDTTVAVVSFSRVLPDSSWAATAGSAGLASAYHPFIERSAAAVAEAAEEAEVVVVMVHWGIELSACPEQYQRDLAALWSEAGADLIVGSHPHVLQGIEQIGGTWVMYSTGNLAFPSAYSEATTRSVLFEAAIIGDEISLMVRPVRLVDGRPTPADEADRVSIIESLNEASWSASIGDGGLAVSAGGDSSCG